MTSSKIVNALIEAIKKTEPNAKIIVTGDFNDYPYDTSNALMEKESALYNPFKTVWSRDKEKLNYNFQWYLIGSDSIYTKFFF